MPRKKQSEPAKRIFRDLSGEQDLFEKSNERELAAKRNAPVTCLGKKFPNDDARRKYFLDELAKKLKDPKFRKIEGFPVGEDEDILALSDPPYYTACPNPWLGDLVAEWEKTKPGRARKEYSREPFAADVSEGKSNAVYAAHSYHTKVPHIAIMRYILHYTDPGDIVFDGFCGTGMTGVAAQECAHPEVYTGQMGTVDHATRAGARRAVVMDLSVLPAFIAANLTGMSTPDKATRRFGEILLQVEEELGHHFRDKNNSVVNYSIWSDVFICPHCQSEVIYWDAAVDLKRGEQIEPFDCPTCNAELTKRSLSRVFEQVRDPLTNKIYGRPKRLPVLVNVQGINGRVTRRATPDDIRQATALNNIAPEAWVPTAELPRGDRFSKDGLHLVNLSHYHRFYFPRALHILGRIWQLIGEEEDRALQNQLRFAVTSMLDRNLTIRNRFVINKYNPAGRINGPLANTLYVPGLSVEQNPIIALRYKSEEAFRGLRSTWSPAAVSTQSLIDVRLPDATIDYIFIDPPFGHNIMYSELNGLTESWLRIHTNERSEAVVNESQKKGVSEYLELMTSCFATCFRLLKPGRWMTVEFHNSQNSIWGAIQEALGRAGFVIADVRTLDKQKGTINQEFYTAGAVKQDLVISAYKTTEIIDREFSLTAGSEEGAWAFVRSHLCHLPIAVVRRGEIEPVVERLSYVLFDRMVAFHVQRGVTLPLSAAEFYRGLDARFPCRDQMYFLPEQVVIYEKRRAKCDQVLQLELFVHDEATGIAWIRQQLLKKPQTFQEIHTQFLREASAWEKHEKPLELRELLEHNFICYAGSGEVPSQIHAYLSTNWKELRSKAKNDPELVDKAKGRWFVPDPKKAEDLEKVRERALLREFWEYLPEGYKPRVKTDMQPELPGMAEVSKVPAGRRMKVIRTEAVRIGFKYCWQNQDYRTIVAVAKRIPEDVLQEDPKLLMWYDQALTRLGEE